MYQRAEDGLHLVKVRPGAWVHVFPEGTYTYVHTHAHTHTCTHIHLHTHAHSTDTYTPTPPYTCTRTHPTLPLVCNLHFASR